MQTKDLSLNQAAIANLKIISLSKDLGLVLVFSILTGLSAQLKVEIGAVPITMQTLAVLMSGILLGSRKGAASQITYLLMGLTGLPWFARGGGLTYLLSPTFGYVLGFVFASFLVGLLVEKGGNKDIKTIIPALLAGEIAIYSIGLLWLLPFVGIGKLLAVGLYPFIFGEFLKLSLIVSFLFLNRKNNHA